MTTPPDDEEIANAVSAASDWFDDVCQHLHEMEQDEVGPLAFLQNDNLREVLTSLAMAANAIRYQYIQLVITHALFEEQEEPKLGAKAFQRVGKEWGKNVRTRGEWGQGTDDSE